MLIPLNTNSNRTNISLGIQVRKPSVLGVTVFDPLRPNTHFMRRKIPVIQNAYRQIQLPLPVTTKKVMLALYDKKDETDRNFKVVDLDVEKMPYSDVWADPERHRFMDFAIDFAQKAGYLKPGFYPSNDYEFLIHYLPTIDGPDGKELVTPARIHRLMPRVQLSRRLFQQFSIPVRVAILAHEGCHYFNNTRSEKEADLCGIRYYLDYGFPTIEAIYAATQVFLQHPDTVNHVHIQRTRDIINFINQYKASSTNKPSIE
jgi:hypothetical protein